jgi:hypothetical protein
VTPHEIGYESAQKHHTPDEEDTIVSDLGEIHHADNLTLMRNVLVLVLQQNNKAAGHA